MGLYIHTVSLPVTDKDGKLIQSDSICIDALLHEHQMRLRDVMTTGLPFPNLIISDFGNTQSSFKSEVKWS